MFARFLIFATILLIPACATVQGLGEDISTAGDAVSEAARDAEDDI